MINLLYKKNFKIYLTGEIDEYLKKYPSDKKKVFIIKVKNKYHNNYFEEVGGSFFTYIKKHQTVSSVDIYADSLSEEKNKLTKIFSEFIFGFNLFLFNVLIFNANSSYCCISRCNICNNDKYKF